mgnify:CR=1 FL=1
MEEQHKERKASYKYSFRLDEQQNIRFCRMLAEAGLEHNRSRFIVKRIFAEEFRVVRIDPTLGRYVTRLNQFYEQIQRVGNNYNQIVRAVNTHFSHTAIPRQVLLLERRTRELKALLRAWSSRSAANFTSYGRANANNTGPIIIFLPTRQNDYLCEGKAVFNSR